DAAIVVVDNPSQVEQLFRQHQPGTTEMSHVLCRLPKEPRRDFAQRILERARSLKESQRLVRLSFFDSESTDLSALVLRQLHASAVERVSQAPSSPRASVA